MTSNELIPIPPSELLECIGELYVQTRLLRQTLARLQQQQQYVPPQNGAVVPRAVPEQ